MTPVAPAYNFAIIPQVESQDDWWYQKQSRSSNHSRSIETSYQPIHMPKDSGIPFIMGFFWFIAGFGLTFEWVWMGVFGLLGVIVSMLVRYFQQDTDYYIPAEQVKAVEESREV